ncbi:MAG: hypothetical protein GY845_03370 [Planctomycetes bacterium]|nr:hypothetical protein [Planctomycetota bacterium]
MSEYYTPPADVIAGVRARSTKINAIIQSTEDGFDALPADLSGTSAEVIAGRDGEASLLAKNQAQDALISALEAAGGVLASFLNGTYLAGHAIVMTDNGDDTLTIDSDPYEDIIMFGG